MMKVALVGATGLVGRVMKELLEDSPLPVEELIPVASEKSVGQSYEFDGDTLEIRTLEKALEKKPDLALFSAGSSVSEEGAPRFAEAGTKVIDNSSAWRMDASKKLIVPEVNADQLTGSDRIIANPNCSTIQMVMTLYPLHRAYGLERVIVSTYQSVTGSGKKAVDQLWNEREQKDGPRDYPHPIDLNCLPHCDDFQDNGYTKEEMKLVNESRKILGLPELAVAPTAVRVPVKGGHGESVQVQLQSDFTLKEVRTLLNDFPGVTLQDNPSQNEYPMPLTAEGHDDVFVGRLRKDLHQPNTLNMWIVSDNLRKGAATNTVQIAEYLYEHELLTTPASAE
jgi:aspartate-semialdehyde dehydrogenase